MPSPFYRPPFSIVRDTRENTPWPFTGLFHGSGKQLQPILVELSDKTLATGDYSLVGHELDISIERKSLPDLFNCCGGDRKRFEEQVRRLNETIAIPYLIVEGDWMMIERWRGPGAHPSSVIGTRISWEQKYPKVKWMFLPSAAVAQRVAFRIFERFYSLRGMQSGQAEQSEQVATD